MTKISKVLVILVTVLAVGQLGVALVSTAARTDWKKRAAEFPRAKTQEWKTEAEGFNRRRDDAVRLTEEARRFIDIDSKALAARAESWNQTLAQWAEQEHALRNQNAAEAVKVQAQKEAALAEARRLRDLLYQSRGVLERALRRQKLLQEDGGRMPPGRQEYEARGKTNRG